MKFKNHPLQIFFLFLFLIGCDSKEARLQKFLLKGNLAGQERNWEQATYYYAEAIRIEPCFEEAWNNLGTVYFQQKNYEKAMENYEKAVSCSPQFIDALLNRANTAYELKEYFRAVNDLEKVITLKPDTSVTYFTLGLTYTKLRDFGKARKAFEKAADLDSLDAGTEVIVVIVTSQWYGVQTPDGHRGWLRRDQVEQLQ